MNFKRIVSLILSICMVLTVASFPVMAASSGTCGDNLTWTLDDSGTLTISGTGAMTNYSYSTAPWYSNRSSITSVTIGDSVTTIGGWAFAYCDSLTSVTIGNSVTTIGGWAFAYCDSLTSVTIPDSVTTIGYSAFSECSSLTSITIPDSVTTIGEYAFENCSSLTSITIPDSVTTIGEGAFGRCTKLVSITVDAENEYYYSQDGVLFNKDKTEIVAYPAGKTATTYIIPNSVTTIGVEAFYGCDFLTSVTIPDGVTSIGYGAFQYCYSLAEVNVDENNQNYSSLDGVLFNKDKTTIVKYPQEKTDTLYIIPNSVTSIGDDAFSYCDSLTSITIPNGVTSIGYSAFLYCTFTSITIPNGVTSIGKRAFNCCSLTSITLPDSVTYIDYEAFSDCRSLTDVYYNGTEEKKNAIRIYSYNDCLYDATWHYFDNACDSTCNDCPITREVSSHAYDGVCDPDCNDCGLTRETPDHVYSSICDPNCDACGAFRETEHTYDDENDIVCNVCGSERPISSPVADFEYTIENGKVTITGYIGQEPEVTIPSAIEGYPVTSIGGHAFDFCNNLTSVTLGDSVTEIGHGAFSNCSKLTNITVDTENQYFSSHDGILFSKDKTTLVKYPIGKTATTYTIPNSVTSIGYDAFSNCSSLTSITIPDSVTTIGSSAFAYCYSLTSVTIGNGVTSIGSYAFSGCSSLTSITIPDSVTKIQNGAFEGCDSLTNITVDEENENFSSQDGVLFNKDKTTIVAYPNGKTATTYTTPDSVTTIGEEAFRSCSSLVSITLGDSVTTIDSYAFAGCDSLISITFGNSVTEIGMRAFEGCSSLTSVTIPASVTKIDLWAFADCTSLTGFTVDEESEYYCSQDGILFSKDKTTIVAYPGDKTASIYTIPESVTTIMPAAFSGCSSLTNIIIPDSMNAISPWAFDGCSSLTSIIIPDSVTTIYHYAFSDCSSLTSITIPDSVTKIGHCAFLSYPPLKDVYYNGTKEQKNSIVIEEYNTGLLDATWHYFDNACDTTCSDCSLTREAEDHVYTDGIDTDCNECGEIRAVPTFVVSNATAKVGNTFSVDVSIKHNSGIVGLRTYIGYDSNVLELVSATAGEDFVDTSFGPTTKNPFNIVWDDSLATESNTTNGVVATLTFKAKEGVKACDTAITLTYDPDDVYDYNLDNVGFATENGTITVFEYIPGDVNGDGVVSNKDLGVLRRFLNDWDVEIDELASDVNRDGKVNNKDMGILRRYLNDWDVELL